eukprot:2139873-Pyramimonas_sp.AAC.1
MSTPGPAQSEGGAGARGQVSKSPDAGALRNCATPRGPRRGGAERALVKTRPTPETRFRARRKVNLAQDNEDDSDTRARTRPLSPLGPGKSQARAATHTNEGPRGSPRGASPSSLQGGPKCPGGRAPGS